MVFLHHIKKEAVLNLCNFLLPNSISELKDLADGEVLQKTIDAKFPEFSENCVELKEQLDVEFVKSDHNEDIFKRFQYIQKFIDERYHLKSEEVIAYDKCLKSCELELAKMALFVLSEIVILLTRQENSTLQTLFLLDASIQEELEECFKLFISEREMIKKSDIERILSKNAKNTVSFITPRRSCASKYRQQDSVSSSTPVKEEIFSNSPLKSFFESPIFKKEDILTKDREINHLKKIMDEEDLEFNKVLNKNKELQKIVEERDKSIQDLREELRELKLEMKTAAKSECASELCKQEKEGLRNASNEDKKKIEDYVCRVSWMEELQMDMCKRINEFEKSRVKDEKPPPEHYMKVVLEEKNSEIKKLQKALTDANENLKERDILISKLMEKERRSEIKSENSMLELKNKFESSNVKETEENAGHFIEEDNRMLRAKLNEAQVENKELTKRIEYLTDRYENYDNKKSPNVMMPELIDTSKTLETEKLRSSENLSENVKEHLDMQNESFSLNNSSKEYAPEQSFAPVPLKVDPCTESVDEAILWKTYDSQLENEKMNVVKCMDPELNRENVNRRDCIVIDDILNLPENIYILEDLNLNSLINSLKSISTNGSFKKVLRVIHNLQSELKLKKTSAANYSKRLNLQELLNIIAECITAAYVQNKSSFSVVNCFETEKEIMHIDQPKFQTSEMIEKYEVQLKQNQEDIESLKKINSDLIAENKTIVWKIKAKKRDWYLLLGEYEELQKRCDEKNKKYSSYKQLYEKKKEVLHKKDEDINMLQNKVVELNFNVKEYRKIIKILKEEKENLNETVQKLSLELTKSALKEVKTNSFEKEVPAVSIKINCITENKSAKVLDPVVSESYCSTFQDIGNESMLSSALCNKTLAPFQFVSHNEEDFLNHSSLADIKKDYEDDRFEELKRRNSQLPLHLQSSYPIEANFPSSENLYVKNSEKEKYKVSCELLKDENESSSKRQKLTGQEPEVQPSSILATPVTRMRKAFKTPTSLKKLLHLSRTRRFQSIRPKP